MIDCATCRELLGGYALEALEPDEAERVRAHLAQCPDCAAELRGLAAVPPLLDTLESIEPLPEPPPGLEEEVLERFSRERVRGRRIAPPRLGRRRLRVAAVAAAMCLIGAGIVLVEPFGSSSDDEAFAQARLKGSPGAPGASARASLDAVREGTRVHLHVAGLPAASSAVYELWCIDDDGRWISGGTFRVDRAGRADVTLTSAARPGEYELMRVTQRSDGERGPSLMAGHVYY